MGCGCLELGEGQRPARETTNPDPQLKSDVNPDDGGQEGLGESEDMGEVSLSLYIYIYISLSISLSCFRKPSFHYAGRARGE